MEENEIFEKVESWNPRLTFKKEDEKYFWFREDQHAPHPHTPMCSSLFGPECPWQYTAAAEEVQLPMSKGIDMRYFRGRLYLGPTSHLINDPQEIQKREIIFRQKLQEFLKNFDDVYANKTSKWRENLDYLHDFPEETVSWTELRSYLEKAIAIQREHWLDHFVMMYLVHSTYLAFEELCSKYHIDEEEMLRMLQGFPNKMFDTDKELWELTRKVQDQGLTDVFQNVKTEELQQKLRETEAGKRWLTEFENFLEQYGNRTSVASFEYVYPSWREDPIPVLETIKSYLAKHHFSFEDHGRKLAAERNDCVRAALNKIDTEDEKAAFKELLAGSQKTYYWNEDHNFYIDSGTFVAMRIALLKIGKHLVRLRLIESSDDVFFLLRDELRELVADLAQNESAAVIINKPLIEPMVRERRQVWKELHKLQEPPLFIGTPPPDGFKDPVGMKVFGMTGIAPERVGERKKRLEGFPGAPGLAEGIARVIISAEEFGKVQAGDILVCSYTSPAWTCLFTKLEAVVTDTGGMLTHAAIAAREYGIPAVVGTWHATKLIKDGDIVRVDGDNGVVEITSRGKTET